MDEAAKRLLIQVLQSPEAEELRRKLSKGLIKKAEFEHALRELQNAAKARLEADKAPPKGKEEEDDPSMWIPDYLSKKEADTDTHRLVIDTSRLKKVWEGIYLEKLDLRRFYPETEGERVVIQGLSGSGKTWFSKAILNAVCDIPYWGVINASEGANHKYEPHLENRVPIVDKKELFLPMLRAAQKRQQERFEQWSIPKTDPVQFKRDVRMGLVVDDAFEEESYFLDAVFKWLYFNSRNFFLLFILLIQFWSLLIPKYRRQVSWFCMFKPKAADIEQMFKQYFPGFGKLEIFKEAINKVCHEVKDPNDPNPKNWITRGVMVCHNSR